MKARGKSPGGSASAAGSVRGFKGSGSIKSDHGGADAEGPPAAAPLSFACTDGENSDPLGNDSSSGLGNSIFYDDPDLDLSVLLGGAHAPDPAMTQKAVEHMQTKIRRTKELIKEEQASRDENVDEYLKLSSNADKVQQARIKQVFEKKNQKSAQTIAHYGKKLEEYHKKIHDLSEHGIRPKQTHKLGQGLKHVGGNIRDGITGMSSTVISKQKEFAHRLRHKFGSVDNLNSFNNGDESKNDNRSHHGSASLPRDNSGLSGAGSSGGGGVKRNSFGSQNKRSCISEDGRRSDRSESLATNSEEQIEQPPSRQKSISIEASPVRELVPPEDPIRQNSHSEEWKTLMQELQLHKEVVEHLREEMKEQQQIFKAEIDGLSEQLREERDRCEGLQEQLNDLIELHQNEMENIKTGVSDMEEKVQYQSEERMLDIKEHLQNLETKVTSMEHAQAQQQYLNIEGLDNTDARAVMMKLLTAVITFVHVMLFVVGVVMSLTRPFLCSSSRALATASFLVAAICLRSHQNTIMAIFRKSTSVVDDGAPS